MSRKERKAMITPGHPALSLTRQCQLIAISRSAFDCTAKGENPENLERMRRIDALFLQCPFCGSRQMVRHLAREEISVGRHRVRRLMHLMGREAIDPAPRTSPPPRHTPVTGSIPTCCGA